MDAKLINLSEWKKFGEGGIGVTYIRKDNSSIILKLNNEKWSPETAYEEFHQSKSVYDMGIPCPVTYDFVTDGKRYGYTAQRIIGKKSFARILADEPSRLKELAAKFASRAKELHSTPCKTELFTDRNIMRKEFINNSPAVPDDIKEKLNKIYEEFDSNASTCLHGDLHIGNLITAEGKEYWIDLGRFSYGDPVFDIAGMYLLAYYFPEKMTREILHVKKRTLRRFYKEFLKCYYGDKYGDAVLLKLKHTAFFIAGLCIAAKPEAGALFIPLIREQKLRFAIISFLARFASAKI